MICGLISLAAGAVCVFQNFKMVEIGPGFSVTCHHRCEDSCVWCVCVWCGVCVWIVVSLLFLFAFLFDFYQFSVDPALLITGCFQQLNWHSLIKSSNSSGDRTCILNVDYCFFYFLITGWYRNFKIRRNPIALYRHQKRTEQ